MANALLRRNKDKAHTKLQLALFTANLEDNKVLAARVAHLEAELAGSALVYGHKADALTALVSAAAAYRTLEQPLLALSCLRRAASLKEGDAECQALLAEAIADLAKALAAAAPKSAPKPAPAPKAEEKPAPKPAPAPKAEKKAEPKKTEKKAEKKAEPKKATKKKPLP